MKYEIYGRGGSIGEQKWEQKHATKKKFVSGLGEMWLLGTADSKEKAKGIAKGFKDGYSTGAKRYYGIKTRIFKVK